MRSPVRSTRCPTLELGDEPSAFDRLSVVDRRVYVHASRLEHFKGEQRGVEPGDDAVGSRNDARRRAQLGRNDRIGREVAAVRDVFEQRGPHQRLNHEPGGLMRGQDA